MPSIKQVVNHLESIAPVVYQESYDNAGLICGDAKAEVTGVITCLDSTEAVIEEAIEKSCNLVVAHHPIVFKGLKRFTGRNYVERTIIKAIKNDIAIYAIHTNLDNVYAQGVNTIFAERLRLQEAKILAPKANFQELRFVIDNKARTVVQVLAEASQCNPPVISALHEADLLEVKVQVPLGQKGAFLSGVRAYAKSEITTVNTLDKNHQVGSGMIGKLAEPMEELDFLKFLKGQMQSDCVKYTALRGKPIQKVALCGGSGGFLLNAAIAKQADIFITADYKYHEFFDADGKIIIADIGHFESEQFTIPLLKRILSNKFSNFAVYETEVRTNPVSYFI